MEALKINSDRLWDSLMVMAKIGGTAKGGCCRLALTDLDKQGRELYIKWAEEAGCTVKVDAVGNIMCTRPGEDMSLPPVGTGSHLDTQPTGGKFDGVYGVLAGLEVVRSMNDQGIKTKHPIEISVWTNEEGSRFAPAMMGSGVVSGRFTLQEILDTKDVDGLRLGDELERIGFAGDTPVTGRQFHAFFETHIEQGPYLEAEEKQVGVVTGGQGQRWYNAVLTGRESHAGTTPMHLRSDALIASSQLVLKVEEIAKAHPPGCGTVGFMQVMPNSRNTIPGEISMSIDLRHPIDEELTKMDAALKAAIKEIEATGPTIALDPFWYYEPIHFNEDCVNAVRQATKDLGYSHMDIIAGAGHDACYVSDFAPTSMIFTPCLDGISHNEIESTTQEECEGGCSVLLNAMLTMAEVV
ncbi:Zn-dependent hydrolase [Psychromonas sp. 14N.309.X.WAT.B.A12]|uniref:Zn-dependent hydrolase n=2 Tax=Psychromonas TaxID=67572 RepID=UPI0025B27CC0|nr:Zn-dependent hydrolase [Psychromonas sp. 14N.309.X.WAT.B.A12]MDN2663602.1 Zn-dependent hydrolase [Psychromonas sp. 14N.309.X.WAT.B.A12]